MSCLEPWTHQFPECLTWCDFNSQQQSKAKPVWNATRPAQHQLQVLCPWEQLRECEQEGQLAVPVCSLSIILITHQNLRPHWGRDVGQDMGHLLDIPTTWGFKIVGGADVTQTFTIASRIRTVEGVKVGLGASRKEAISSSWLEGLGDFEEETVFESVLER